jgi:hypothetical protein
MVWVTEVRIEAAALALHSGIAIRTSKKSASIDTLESFAAEVTVSAFDFFAVAAGLNGSGTISVVALGVGSGSGVGSISIAVGVCRAVAVVSVRDLGQGLGLHR